MTQTIVGSICTPEEFDDNLKIDFSSFVRSKGGISYLPWAEIVRTLHKKVPHCTYAFADSEDGGIIHYTPEGGAYFRPYLIRNYFQDSSKGQLPLYTIETPAGFFPVSDMRARHKALVKPDIRNIDNCLRRAIAKEIGVMTGIGLQLWAAEDPYDLVDEEEEPSSVASKPSRIIARGTTSATATTAIPNPAFDSAPVKEKLLDGAAEASGLDAHGKATVAMALKVEAWEDIPAEKAPKLIQLLANPDNVKLFNAGKNSTGKSINPKTREQELTEIADAFKKAATD